MSYLIEVKGGVLVAIYSADIPNSTVNGEIYVADYDNIEAGDTESLAPWDVEELSVREFREKLRQINNLISENKDAVGEL